MFAGKISEILAPLTVVVGIMLLVLGVARLRLRWLAAGAALLSMAALLALLADDEPWKTIEVVNLRVRAIDASTGRSVTPVGARVLDGADGTSASISTTDRGGVVLVSAVVEASGNGSLRQLFKREAESTKADGYRLQIEADGYRPWQAPLAEVLPRQWPVVVPKDVVEIRLEPEDFGL